MCHFRTHFVPRFTKLGEAWFKCTVFGTNIDDFPFKFLLRGNDPEGPVLGLVTKSANNRAFKACVSLPTFPCETLTGEECDRAAIWETDRLTV